MTDLKGLWETLKQIRHRSPQPKFCPSCKGRNIYPISILGILPTIYKCRDCGYEGVIVIEVDREPDRPPEPN